LLDKFWGQEVLKSWLLLTGIPQILFNGLIKVEIKPLPVIA
jgi:hypothetical protein